LETTLLEARARELDRKLADFITRPNGNDSDFNALALKIFAYQYDGNAPYRSLCERLGRSPRTVTSWTDVPAVAAASFADVRLACFPPERTVLRFVSSGTTRAGSRNSVHELDTTVLYDASLSAHFRRCVLPDRPAITMIVLSPPFEEAPQSSLAYMLSRLFARYADGGGFFISGGKLESDALIRELTKLRQPVLLFGTALAFVHLLEVMADERVRFTLPAGSRLVETGGFKGQNRMIERAAFYRSLSRAFGVPLDFCISEYGMCELGSQWYDANLADALTGDAPRYELKIGPHWTRVGVVDPVTLEAVPQGHTGLLRVFDLANRGSVAAVLTGDLVRSNGDGFVFLGRSPAAPPKGCSITIDSLLRAHG
jgi:hypothetical protein